jgi:restriction endonuclease
MKLQFDANQTFQLAAISAVADLFDGQPQGAPEFSVIKMTQDTELFAGQERSELGLGNHLLVDDDKLRANTRSVQSRNDIELSNEAAALEGWEIFDPATNAARSCPHFSVEMETGTGKTYVYLRTVFELSRRYGFKKFIVVVPIRKETDEKPNRLKKEVMLSADFKTLWNRIKPRTTYRVEFSTDELVMRAVAGVKKMEKIQPAKIRLTTGRVDVLKGGVGSTILSVAEEAQEPYGAHHAVPDVLAYLQNETELTRSTLVRILKESGRLGEFLVNPQRFMDQVASILKYELHRLLVDGIKYERIAGAGPEAEWEMVLFKNEELVNLLTALQVKKSVYQYVEYESEVEREFAKKLDQRDDIRLFVKLPDWFKVDTPVGGYNPDWAIVKHDDETIYLVRETKGTKDFLKLRTTEADKVRCGQRHFEALGVPFAVVTAAEDI